MPTGIYNDMRPFNSKHLRTDKTEENEFYCCASNIQHTKDFVQNTRIGI